MNDVPNTESATALPDWPTRTIAVLATLGDGPHAIPVSAPVRAGDRRILFSLHRTRGSLSRLRERPQVALVVLAGGDTAFTARGRADIVEEPMAVAPGYAAVAIEVEQIDDHRQEAFRVEGGVDRGWLDVEERDALGERVRGSPRSARKRRSRRADGMRLRPATEADVPRLTALVRSAYGHYVERIGGPPGPMTEDYADVVRSSRVTVAERDGEAVGLVVMGADDEGFFIANVAVDPSHQGAGVGRALLEHAEQAARHAGFDSVYLYTHERMTENIALYTRIGYVEYDRRPVGLGAHLVYLRKPLG